MTCQSDQNLPLHLFPHRSAEAEAFQAAGPSLGLGAPGEHADSVNRIDSSYANKSLNDSILMSECYNSGIIKLAV